MESFAGQAGRQIATAAPRRQPFQRAL